MKITEIKNQFSELLNKGLISFIDTTPIIKSHPQYPNIKIESIDVSKLELEDDDIDVLLGGEELNIEPFNNSGIYWATDREMNGSQQKSMKLYVRSLTIKIENENLVIKECSCFAISNNQF
jgi:hypothetical protein